MRLGSRGSYIVPRSKTLSGLSAAVRQLTMDITILASTTPASGVIFDYGGDFDFYNAMSLWNPANLTVAVNNHNYETGINLNDGKDHRISASWNSAAGSLAVYDNGVLVRTFSNVATGRYLSGGGEVAIGGKPTESGNYDAGYTGGLIQRVSLAERTMTAAELARPMYQTLTGSAMAMDVVAQGGKIIDTTGRNQWDVLGDVSIVPAAGAPAR